MKEGFEDAAKEMALCAITVVTALLAFGMVVLGIVIGSNTPFVWAIGFALVSWLCCRCARKM